MAPAPSSASSRPASATSKAPSSVASSKPSDAVPSKASSSRPMSAKSAKSAFSSGSRDSMASLVPLGREESRELALENQRAEVTKQKEERRAQQRESLLQHQSRAPQPESRSRAANRTPEKHRSTRASTPATPSGLSPTPSVGNSLNLHHSQSNRISPDSISHKPLTPLGEEFKQKQWIPLLEELAIDGNDDDFSRMARELILEVSADDGHGVGIDLAGLLQP